MAATRPRDGTITDTVENYDTVIEGLKDLYRSKVRPLEELYKFPEFASPSLEDADFEAKPMVVRMRALVRLAQKRFLLTWRLWCMRANFGAWWANTRCPRSFCLGNTASARRRLYSILPDARFLARASDPSRRRIALLPCLPARVRRVVSWGVASALAHWLTRGCGCFPACARSVFCCLLCFADLFSPFFSLLAAPRARGSHDPGCRRMRAARLAVPRPGPIRRELLEQVRGDAGHQLAHAVQDHPGRLARCAVR